MKGKELIRFVITWIILFLIIDFTMGLFGFGRPDPYNEMEGSNTVLIETTQEKVSIGKDVMINIRNYTEETLEITQTNCDPGITVLMYQNGTWENALSQADCEVETSEVVAIEPNHKLPYAFQGFGHLIFDEIGSYKVVMDVNGTEFSSKEFTIKNRGFFKRGWDTLFYKPLYNALIYLTGINPWHNFGVAIVLLTLIIRLILLVPSRKGIQSQKRMQEIQPKIQRIQEKYKGNQERIAMETMALWKSAKVNPFGSCLPLLIQFPVLIALYFSVRGGVDTSNTFMLYEFQKNFDYSAVDTMFLSLDLTQQNMIVLPVIVGLLQFGQMKLMFSMRKMPKKKTPTKEGMPDMQTMNRVMTYMMPLMIAFFTATLPSGVGLYWGTSTIFGIGQTYMINRAPSDESDSLNNSDGVKVKVIEADEKEKYLPKAKKSKKKK